MNYLTEIRLFNEWLETSEVTTSGIALWYALMHIANRSALHPGLHALPAHKTVPVGYLQRTECAARMRTHRLRCGRRAAEFKLPDYRLRREICVHCCVHCCVHHSDTTGDINRKSERHRAGSIHRCVHDNDTRVYTKTRKSRTVHASVHHTDTIGDTKRVCVHQTDTTVYHI